MENEPFQGQQRSQNAQKEGEGPTDKWSCFLRAAGEEIGREAARKNINLSTCIQMTKIFNNVLCKELKINKFYPKAEDFYSNLSELLRGLTEEIGERAGERKNP